MKTHLKAIHIYSWYERCQLIKLNRFLPHKSSNAFSISAIQYKEGCFYATDGFKVIRAIPVDDIIKNLGIEDGDFFTVEHVTKSKTIVVIQTFEMEDEKAPFKDITKLIAALPDYIEDNKDPDFAFDPKFFSRALMDRDEPTEVFSEGRTKPFQLFFKQSMDTVWLMPLNPGSNHEGEK
jgi:hypothetical protein